MIAAPSAFQLTTYAADGASYAATGKTVTDHLISEVTAKDCALKRVLDGQDICQDIEIERYPDGTPVPKAKDAAKDIVPAKDDQAFQSFAANTADPATGDQDEMLMAQAEGGPKPKAAPSSARSPAPGAALEAATEQDALSADGEDIVPTQNIGDAGDEDEGLDAFDIQQIEQSQQRQ